MVFTLDRGKLRYDIDIPLFSWIYIQQGDVWYCRVVVFHPVYQLVPYPPTSRYNQSISPIEELYRTVLFLLVVISCQSSPHFADAPSYRTGDTSPLRSPSLHLNRQNLTHPHRPPLYAPLQYRGIRGPGLSIRGILFSPYGFWLLISIAFCL